MRFCLTAKITCDSLGSIRNNVLKTINPSVMFRGTLAFNKKIEIFLPNASAQR